MSLKGDVQMLGKKVNIEIFGTISEGSLYFGYYIECGKTYKVYIMTRHRLGQNADCVIIAQEQLCGSKSLKLVAAPQGEIFYEPEIRTRIVNAHTEIKNMVCLYEKSCGAVVYRRIDGEMKYLLVKNHNGRCWSFPKGHIEIGESEKQTAAREIKEETGLDVRFNPDFRETGIYHPFGRTSKKVVFFLAEAKSDKVNIQRREIDYYRWVTMGQAKNLCSHENDIRILEKVSFYLEPNTVNR